MEESLGGRRRLKVEQTLGSLFFTLVACGAASYLLYSAGPISTYLDVDLGFLIFPFLGYYLLRLFSRLSSLLLTPLSGKALAYGSNGIAFCLFGYCLLSQAALFARVPGLQGYEWFLARLSHLTPYSLLLIATYPLVRLTGLLAGHPRAWLASAAGRALGQCLAGYSLWHILAAFSTSWAPLDGLGLIVFGGMLALAMSSLGAYGEGSRNPLLARAARWLKQGQPGKFLLGGAIAAYVVFARPAIAGIFHYSPIAELAIVCLVAWRLFAGVRAGLLRRYSVPLEAMEWRKHEPQIAWLADRHFKDLNAIQRRFVQEGNRDGLLVHLALLLGSSGLRQEEVAQALHPLINHRDREPPWFAFGWEQRRILRRNQLKRQRILNGILENLRTAAQPAFRKVEAEAYENSQPS